MSPDINNFYGQDVPSAIKEACETLGVAQENLTIEVVETGSKGIFGLIRRKAHIRAFVKPSQPEQHSPEAGRQQSTDNGHEMTVPSLRDTAGSPACEQLNNEHEPPLSDEGDVNGDDEEDNSREPVELSPETLSVIRLELSRLLELMECPSTVSVENQDGTALCIIGTQHESILISQDGRTLDSLQYLLRKIISRKIPGRIQLSIDVGDYRARRHDELRGIALTCATQVKENGKTQVIPSLNPSERRVVHVSLQDDPEIRSRSIGDGLFKKVLIYKPGKPKKGGRKRMHAPSRKKDAANKES